MNLRQNRYEQHVLPLNYKPFSPNEVKIKVYTLMRTISAIQIIILIIITILILSDFSKIKKRVIDLFKKPCERNRRKGG